MNHYTYRITNKELNKHYYGVRSSNKLPSEDIGIYYFSSSTDKDFIQDQKDNPQDYKYKVIRISNTRKEANLYEVELHNKFNVAINENFYNKAKSTSSGFSTAGTKLSEERKKQIGILSKERKRSPMSQETKDKIGAKHKGKEVSEETRKKQSKAFKGRKHTEEAKKKISENNYAKKYLKGVKRSEETIKKMVENRKPMNHTEESKMKMSEAKKGKKQKIIKCPHCSKEGGTTMHRWHFDNCKMKEI